jgi:hypothetical protein
MLKVRARVLVEMPDSGSLLAVLVLGIQNGCVSLPVWVDLIIISHLTPVRRGSQDASTPLLPNETFPRQCDLFTTTHSSESDTWSTHAMFSLPLQGELYFHGRGDYLSGRLDVSIGQLPRKEGHDDEVLVKVEAVYRKADRLEGWHVCRTGDDKVAGVVLVVSFALRAHGPENRVLCWG